MQFCICFNVYLHVLGTFLALGAKKLGLPALEIERMCHAVIEPGIWAKGCFQRQSLLGNPLCVLRLEVTLSRPTSHAGELQAVTDFSSPPPCSSLAAQGQRPTCRANTAVAGLLFPKMKQSWAVLPSQIQSKSDVTDGLMGLLCLEILKPGKMRRNVNQEQTD